MGRIDGVIVAGDMMDYGRGAFGEEEYQKYLKRFKSIFKVPEGVGMWFVPGNHDLGLGPNRGFSPHAKERYARRYVSVDSLPIL